MRVWDDGPNDIWEFNNNNNKNCLLFTATTIMIEMLSIVTD